MQERFSSDAIWWFFLALFLASIFMLGWLIWPFISILIMGAVVAGVFQPLYHWGVNHFRLGAATASFVTCLVIFMVLFIPIVFFVGVLTQEAYELVQAARSAELDDQLRQLLDDSRILERINLFLANFKLQVTGEELNKAVSQAGLTVGRFLFEQANNIAANVLKFLVNFFFMLLVIYFLLLDGSKLIAFIEDLSPLPADQDEMLVRKFKHMAGAILVGNGLAGLIQGSLGGMVFALFGIQSAFLWGVVMALLAFLPIVGIGVVFVPAAIYLFLVGRIGAGLFFILFYVLLSSGIEYMLKPKLVGSRVRMHTLLVFLSIMGGLKLFGILGIIYGPLIVTAFLTLTDIYQANYQRFINPATSSRSVSG